MVMIIKQNYLIVINVLKEDFGLFIICCYFKFFIVDSNVVFSRYFLLKKGIRNRVWYMMSLFFLWEKN